MGPSLQGPLLAGRASPWYHPGLVIFLLEDTNQVSISIDIARIENQMVCPADLQTLVGIPEPSLFGPGDRFAALEGRHIHGPRPIIY